jgi:hypothetical protein
MKRISRAATVKLVATHLKGMGRTVELAHLEEWWEEHRNKHGEGLNPALVSHMLMALHGGYDSHWAEVVRMSQKTQTDCT